MRGISFGAPTVEHAFFEQSEFERLLRHNFLQVAGFTAQILNLVSVGRTRVSPARRRLPTSMKSLDHL